MMVYNKVVEKPHGRCKIQYVSKFGLASHSSLYDSMALVSFDANPLIHLVILISELPNFLLSVVPLDRSLPYTSIILCYHMIKLFSF